MSGSRRKEMAAIKPLVLQQDYDGIAQEILSMKRLWQGKGLDGLLKRRDDEAALVSQSDRGYKKSEAGSCLSLKKKYLRRRKMAIKNIIVCADGTGNKGGYSPDSNVYRIYKAVDKNFSGQADNGDEICEQIVFYDNGVGTEKN